MDKMECNGMQTRRIARLGPISAVFCFSYRFCRLKVRVSRTSKSDVSSSRVHTHQFFVHFLKFKWEFDKFKNKTNWILDQ